MIHFLRWNQETIVDCSATDDDFSVIVCIRPFGHFLLEIAESDQHEVIEVFHALQELRGDWYEGGVRGTEHVDNFIERKFREVAKQCDLQYVTD